jgi:carbon-monoxide dehydrogenase large subunit
MYFGQPIRRREDVRFLTGAGRFVDDIKLPGMAHIAFARSPHAHALIRDISTARAASMPGVLRVLTAADWAAAGLGKLVCVHPMPFSDGRPMNEKLRPLFATGKVCHVGDVVACIVAESRNAALDAAEAVEVDYEPLPAVTDVARALDADVPVLHPELGSNLVFEIERGDRAKTAAAFASASHVTELTLRSNRVAGNPMEPRAWISQYDAATGHYTVWATSQTPHYHRRWLAKYLLFEPESRIRLISPDVGGGFGLKVHLVEGAIVVWASKLVGRPVKWTATRSESFMSDSQARDHHTRARMALDRDGGILAMEVDTMAALGGYLSQFAPSIPGNSYPQTITGLYTTPLLWLRVRGVYTNTLPIDAYRGSGRPEATFVNERLIDNAAREMGIDAVDIRRRNLIPAERFPYPTPVGRTYDSGDPPGLFEKLLVIADYDALRAEQRRLRGQGVLMGIGLACFLDKSGTGSSRNLASKGGLHGGYESATVRIHSDGKATVFLGSHCHGQGHETAFTQIAADRLGLPIEDIELVEGDTSQVPFGNGTWGSRSASVGGAAIVQAADRVIDKARRLAAHVLECAGEDLDYAEDLFRVRGTDRAVSFADIADIAYHGSLLPLDRSLSPGLEETVFYEPTDTNDPQAMHLAVVLVDAQTGRVTVRDYFTADDCGRIINPMIVEGQVHGGLAQGIGQAMMEHVIYGDGTGPGADGQLLTGSFMDYAMPRASDMPQNLGLVFQEIPCPSNALGVKGGSETGTIGPPACIANAVVDALWHLGVRHVTLPITSQTVWRALEAAKVTG